MIEIRCSDLTKLIAIALLESIVNEKEITQDKVFKNFEKSGILKRGKSLTYHWRKLRENGLVDTTPNLYDMRRKYFKISQLGIDWLNANKHIEKLKT